MKKSILFAAFVLLFNACGPAVSPELLDGKWNYVRLQSLTWNPDSVTVGEIAIQKPYVKFGPENHVQMIWGGDTLLKGTFTTKGSDILVNQVLPGGKTREFPFKVISLTKDELVFESTDRDASRVTTKKE